MHSSVRGSFADSSESERRIMIQMRKHRERHHFQPTSHLEKWLPSALPALQILTKLPLMPFASTENTELKALQVRGELTVAG
jgi:hypothetical protein